MIITRHIVKCIEDHLYNWKQEQKEVESKRKEIAERKGYDLSCVKNQNAGDPVLEKVIKIEQETGMLGKWVGVVEATCRHFEKTPYLSLIETTYFKRESIVKVCSFLFIERRTYFKWKNDVILYAAMKACEAGLISV